MNEFHIENGRGFSNFQTGKVITFEVQGVAEREEIKRKEFLSLYSKYAHENNTMRLDGFIVPMWGDGHNLYPQEVFSTTSENKLLPEVISKQVKFLYGNRHFPIFRHKQSDAAYRHCLCLYFH